jgi:osmoprotectant transport system permease protein
MSGLLAQGEPVIPDFGEASACVTENRLFCSDWVRDNWGGVIQPALVEHVKLTVIAVVLGFAIALAAALLTHRYRLLERPFVTFSAVVYTIPSLALFQLLVPLTPSSATRCSSSIATSSKASEACPPRCSRLRAAWA